MKIVDVPSVNAETLVPQNTAQLARLRDLRLRMCVVFPPMMQRECAVSVNPDYNCVQTFTTRQVGGLECNIHRCCGAIASKRC